MTTVIAVFVALIALAIVVLVCVVRAQGAKLKAAEEGADKAEQESAVYRQAMNEAEARASRLKQALAGNVDIEEKANVERQELAKTNDADLARRANSLFSGGV
jgi:flagellar biosynthesis/type III secretory pathway M-ring protein FliF/YscJ